MLRQIISLHNGLVGTLCPQLVHQLSQLHDDTAKDITLVSDFYKCCLEVQYTRAALQNTQHVGIADNEGAVPSVDVFQKLTGLECSALLLGISAV